MYVFLPLYKKTPTTTIIHSVFTTLLATKLLHWFYHLLFVFLESQILKKIIKALKTNDCQELEMQQKIASKRNLRIFCCISHGSKAQKPVFFYDQ